MKKSQKPIPVTIVHSPSERIDPEPYRPKDSMHMSVRQIDNGYIVNTHGYKDGKHFDNDVYTPYAPKIAVPGNRTRARTEPADPSPPSATSAPSRARASPQKQRNARLSNAKL